MKRVMLSAAVLASVVACGGKGGDAQSGGAPAQAGSSAAAATPSGGGGSGPTGTSSISGSINLTGTAPKNPTIDMSQETACRGKYTSGPPTDPQFVVTNGKLGNVFVYVSKGLPAGATYTAPDAAVEIDQDGCLYHPRVFGVMVNQKILIKNGDPVLHNIKAVPKTNRGFNISQPSQGMTTTRTFAAEEQMVPLQCNVHSWMNAWVGVMSHPFFATSGPDGSFSIKNLPPGTYTITAWHEKLGTQEQTVTVGAGEAKTADFSFSVKA